MADNIVVQRTHFDVIYRARNNLARVLKQPANHLVLQSRIESLRKTWTKAEALHEEISKAFTGKTRDTMDYFNDDEFAAAEEAFLEVSDALHLALSNVLPVPAGDTSTGTRDNSGMDSSLRNRLPRISLPRFNGSLLDWESFRDLFTSLVIEDHQLSNVEKLHYLKSCLTGEAYTCVKNISITDANFDSTWSFLNSRYNNRRMLIYARIDSLLDIPAAVSSSAAELQRVVDSVHEILDSLKNLKESVDTWDSLLTRLVMRKIDSQTRRDWDIKIGNCVEVPKYIELETFIWARIRAFTPTNAKVEKFVGKSSRAVKSEAKVHMSTVSPVCRCCNETHNISDCEKFKALSPDKRMSFVKGYRGCFKCLRPGHYPSSCTRKNVCSQCKHKHHTLLHLNVPAAIKNVNSTAEINSNDASVNTHLSSDLSPVTAPVLLATAWLRVSTPTGREMLLRALIDTGAERSFISENAAQILRVTRGQAPVSIRGLSGVICGQSNHATVITIRPRLNDTPRISVNALIINSLTAYAPRVQIKPQSWRHVDGLELADDDPTSTHRIDIILGADVCGGIMLPGIRKGSSGEPVAQQSVFGWILYGPLATVKSDVSPDSVTSLHVTSNADLLQSLQKFWELEEITEPVPLAPEEQKCENYFKDTVKRNADGRYIVRLPFNVEPPNIGNSLVIAQSCYNKLHKRLLRDSSLAEGYNNFLSEYLALRHMSPDTPVISEVEPRCFLPHHPVFKDSTTTKIRIVFNASCITSNGKSLNDNLLVGPKLHHDLASIILRWRMHKFVCTADIEKMFRQILVDERDTIYQCILWQAPGETQPHPFRLHTVTYGTASAPFLAMRVLHQLATDEKKRYPRGALTLLNNIYVDDVLFGADSIPQCRVIRDELNLLLKAGCFRLRKWASNSRDLLVDLPPSDIEASPVKTLKQDDGVKILGIKWLPTTDSFHYQIKVEAFSGITKRQALSFISKLFDPLGWISPIIITAKIFLQQLWREKIDWDNDLPDTLQQQWSSYSSQLQAVDTFKVNRWVFVTQDCHSCQLHGFADASSSAYAAVIYLRVETPDGIKVSLIASKTRVAPVKTLSIPRLELCAAELLSKLSNFVISSLQLQEIPLVCWSDSSVTLHWLNQHPSRWKVFVANRVAKICTRIPQAHWRYVPTSQNPADIASRGMDACSLQQSSLWWNGPHWLSQTEDTWPINSIVSLPLGDLEEKTCVNIATTQESPEWSLISRFSSWPRLLRVTALIFRFVSRLQRIGQSTLPPVPSGHEVRKARLFLIRYIQSRCFDSEIASLIKGSSLKRSSKIYKLNPFLDADGILRVGGRLQQSTLSFSVKHPMLLADHTITQLIIKQAHLRALHGGPQLTLRILRETYWILGARNLVRKLYAKCVVCIRQRAAPLQQQMGNLPCYRTNPTRPFQQVGVDYAGPISIRSLPGRGRQSHKAYIALFICLVTRAIHLELVTDYSSGAFLATFQRFCSRRGIPTTVYSDNGTTFQGADKELRAAFAQIRRDAELASRWAADEITWKFIPPSAPHFGGIWEAGVKSVKHHLRRIVGDHRLTIEEFMTLLCQIEACINSRPLAPLSLEPSDFEYLTPAHFLIGAPLMAIPEPSFLDLNENRLNRWQLIQRMRERFWRLWHSDYLLQLQQRYAWPKPCKNIEIGELVLLRNENLPPSKWELGRVVESYPGSDGLVRVVAVRTANTTYKRPIAKLCRLPIQLPPKEKTEIVNN